MQEAIAEELSSFSKLMENPAQYEAQNPDVTLEELLFLHESFVLLEPMGEKWGRWVISKCSCQGFFEAGICGHSLLFAMLYDRSLTFPPEESSARLPRRGKKGKIPNAWAPENEDEEECPSAKQHWCPVTVASEDMIVTKSRTDEVICQYPSVSHTDQLVVPQVATESESDSDAALPSPVQAAVDAPPPQASPRPSPSRYPRQKVRCDCRTHLV
jgi:hypothetical protein